MAKLERVFVTKIYRAALTGAKSKALNADLKQTCHAIAEEDHVGRKWSREHAYPGYTSYASLNDLTRRATVFDDLRRQLDRHVRAFSRSLDFELAGKRLELDSMWINILDEGGVHSGHIHPHSVISGTYYVAVPKRASALKFEDPRLGLMMASPTVRERAALENQRFVEIAPAEGTVLLWESWLRHEVPRNPAKQKRISISFNYAWR
jgi:uncharacterized protein (TIGR02466 family)